MREDALVIKLIRDQPNTFMDDLASATQEQQAPRAFGLWRKTKKPMGLDVNTVSSCLKHKLDLMTDIHQEVLKISVIPLAKKSLAIVKKDPMKIDWKLL